MNHSAETGNFELCTKYEGDDDLCMRRFFQTLRCVFDRFVYNKHMPRFCQNRNCALLYNFGSYIYAVTTAFIGMQLLLNWEINLLEPITA